MDILFFDWAPIESRSQISKGGHVRRYFALVSLRSKVNNVVTFRNSNGTINRKILKYVFKKNKIWVEYGCGRFAHICVLLISFITSKDIILNVHDFAIQQEFFDNKYHIIKEMQLSIIEKLLLKHAKTIILAWPKMTDFYSPKKHQQIIIMPPGIEIDQESVHNPSDLKKGKKTALYFGSMNRKGIIPQISSLFSNIPNWELNLLGQQEGQKVDSTKNIQYLGWVPHTEINSYLSSADVILIPLPHNIYTEKLIPMKLNYALYSCKPIITTKLPGIHDFIMEMGLETNVIYIDNWDIDNLINALKITENIEIEQIKTKRKLETLDWSKRFDEVVDLCLKDNIEYTCIQTI